MNSAATSPTIRPFASDETVRWSCRAGEFVLWIGTDSFLTSDRASAWAIRDFWQTRDGDFVTITNRWPDLPTWFELHPTEVAGGAAFEMMKRLNAGYRPKEPIDGPNIWRVKAGDRLVWVTPWDTRQPAREILDFRACAVAIGESSNSSPEAFVGFGAPHSTDLPPADAAAMRYGFDSAAALEVPRVFAPEWRFGA